MENFWKWIMQANARNVFAIALLVLLTVTTGSAWHYLATASQPEEEPKPEPALPALTTPTSAGLRNYILAQCANQPIPPFDPFTPALDKENTPRQPRSTSDWKTPGGYNSGSGSSSSSSGGKTTTTQGNQGKPVTAVNPAKPPPVTLTYKGYMTRADGVSLALIHDSASGTTRFLDADQTLAGATLLSVKHGALTLRLPNGDETTLPLHESLAIE